MFGSGPSEVRRHPLVLAGTPEQLAEELTRRRDHWGIDSLLLPSSATRDTIEAFGSRVLPLLG